jgi:GDP-mannose 6-dehydrogenase
MHIGARNGLQLPLIDSLLASNEHQIAAAYDLITSIGGGSIGMLGLAFKSGTDDLRESPMVELMARLIAAGRIVHVSDPSLTVGPRLSAQIGHIRQSNPSLAPALDALESGDTLQATAAVMQTCDVIIVAHATDAFRQAVHARRPTQHVIDLARLFPDVPAQDTYHGLSW